MKKSKKIAINLFFSIVSVWGFWALESGFQLRNGDEFIKSIVFAASLFMVLSNKHKEIVLWISIFLLLIMIFFYLLWQIPLASMFGSIGFGIFVIYVFSFIPNLIKKGFVEK